MIKSQMVIAVIFLVLGCKDLRLNHTYDEACVIKLHTLLDRKEYFRLEKQLNECKEKIEPSQRLYYRAFVDNAFNRNESSSEAIDSLLNPSDSSQLKDSAKAVLHLLQGDDYFKLFQYAKAAKADSIVLSSYSKSLDSEKIEDIKNDLLIRNALRNTPAQHTSISNTNMIRWRKDRIGLIEIPLKHNGSLYSSIFDTRANISSITETYAAKLGLKILPVSYTEESGITGNTFKTGLGVADSFYIGNVLLRNIVFQVMPDSILYIAPLHFSMNIIIGFPVISQLKEVDIFKDGRMTIPLVQTQSDLHNFALDGLNPVISLKTGQDTLCFNFDLGATTTILYNSYFEKNKAEILKNSILKKTSFGGAGGIQTKETYKLPSIDLVMGDKSITVDSVVVLTEKTYPNEKFYGNIGNDFASHFNELILNFEKMFIKGN